MQKEIFPNLLLSNLSSQLKPWNVDTISQEGFSKTAINKQLTRKTEELTEEEKEKRTRQFVKENEKDLKV